METLLAAGARVLTVARNRPEKDNGAEFLAADATIADECDLIAEAVKARMGGVDIVVHNLGGSSSPAGGYAVLSDAQWQKEWT